MDQIEMDFANDPDPESTFPVCDSCGGVDDLHLTLFGDSMKRSAKLECASCRGSSSALVDTRIPLALLARGLLSRLFEMKAVSVKERNVVQYEKLLEAEFASKWDALRKRSGGGQATLFGGSDPGGLGLG